MQFYEILSDFHPIFGIECHLEAKNDNNMAKMADFNEKRLKRRTNDFTKSAHSSQFVSLVVLRRRDLSQLSRRVSSG